MTNRKIVEAMIADWRQREANARRVAAGAAGAEWPNIEAAEQRADFCAARALALERLLAVADAAEAVVDWDEPPDEELDRLENAVRAWEEP